MHVLFALARFFPFWALPLGFVIAELGWFFRRRGSRLQYACFSGVGFLFVFFVLWVVFRGDLHSDQWVRRLMLK